jgi:hypothetical protein
VGLQILKEIIDAGAIIRVLDRSYIDLTSSTGRMSLQGGDRFSQSRAVRSAEAVTTRAPSVEGDATYRASMPIQNVMLVEFGKSSIQTCLRFLDIGAGTQGPLVCTNCLIGEPRQGQ